MRGALRRAVIGRIERAGQLERALQARNRARAAGERWARRIRLASAGRALRATAAARPERLLTTVGRQPRQVHAVVAERRADGSILAVMGANRDFVRTALDATGIHSHPLPLDSPNRYRLAVVHEQDQVLHSLIVAAPSTSYVYFDSASIRESQRIQHLATASPRKLRRLGEKAAVWRVFNYQAGADGHDVLGDIHGCEIEFWRSAQDPSTVRSRRWNRYAVELARDEFGTDATSPAMPLVETVDFPIDIVYTWVDGSDPRWLERRSASLGHADLGRHHHEAASEARYISREELRYSLRSVERFADFVNHVYVVTDDQCPPWLRRDHPGLTVVDHREIFPEGAALPTFNSHAIESRLHHVPGLSEHYLYLNDDFFFAGRVEPSHFFHGNGLAKFFWSRALIPVGADAAAHKPVDAAAINGRRVIAGKFGKVLTRKFKHAPYPQLRSVQLDIEDLFPDEVAATTASRVRSPSDLALASSLHHHVAYLTGRAAAGTISTYYADLGQFNLEGRLAHLLRHRRYDTFCLNDSDRGEVPDDVKSRLLADFLEQYFPDPSSYER